ncbi:hypothetical protein ACEPPN_016995 [Leptodophora sp. 'Broadleaf-Isolate-01']
MEVWGVKEKFLGREIGEERDTSGGGARMGFLYDLIAWIMDEWPEVNFWADLGIPKPDGSDVESVGGLEDKGVGEGHDVRRHGEDSGTSVEATGAAEGDEGGEDEDEGFKIVIIHSRTCHSSREDAVDPSCLMIRGFEEDVVEMMKAVEYT